MPRRFVLGVFAGLLVLFAGVATAEALTWGSPVAVTSNGGGYALISCPTATSCTVVNGGYAYTFNPSTPSTITAMQVLPSLDGFSGFSCPLSTECVLLGKKSSNTVLVSFNPTLAGVQTANQVTNTLSLATGSPTPLLACASGTLCTVVGDQSANTDPSEVTLNPSVGNATQSTGTLAFTPGAVACPLSTQCSVAGTSGQVETFNEGNPGATTYTGTANASVFVLAMACPSGGQCTAVDSTGGAFTFNPVAIGTPAVGAIDGSDDNVTAIACGAVTDCIAATASGPVLEGNPQSTALWSGSTLEANTAMNSLSCPAAGVCVAVDLSGNVVSATTPAQTTTTATTPTVTVFTQGPTQTVTTPGPTQTVTTPGQTQTVTVTTPGTATTDTSSTTTTKTTTTTAQAKPSVGKGAVNGVAATTTGLKVSLRCTGSATARCTFRLSLAAGIKGVAASKTVTVDQGSTVVALVLVANAQKTLDRYHTESGELTTSEKLNGSFRVINKRTVTLHAAKR